MSNSSNGKAPIPEKVESFYIWASPLIVEFTKKLASLYQFATTTKDKEFAVDQYRALRSSMFEFTHTVSGMVEHGRISDVERWELRLRLMEFEVHLLRVDQLFPEVAKSLWKSDSGKLLNGLYQPSSIGRLPINPCYDSDLDKLDGNWKLDRIINKNTVIIVVGDNLISELLDRPSAALLRMKIEELAGIDDAKRGLIVGFRQWTEEKSLHSNPTIAIGGEKTNKLTGLIVARRKELKKDPWSEGKNAFSAIVGAEPPLGARVALWGSSAADTRRAVEGYITRHEGLLAFLDQFAGWKNLPNPPSGKVVSKAS